MKLHQENHHPMTCIGINGTPKTEVKSIVEVLNSYFSSIGSSLASLVRSRFEIIRRAIAPSSVNGTRASTFSEFKLGILMSNLFTKILGS